MFRHDSSYHPLDDQRLMESLGAAPSDSGHVCINDRFNINGNSPPARFFRLRNVENIARPPICGGAIFLTGAAGNQAQNLSRGLLNRSALFPMADNVPRHEGEKHDTTDINVK